MLENNLIVDLSTEMYVALDPPAVEAYKAEYGDDWYQELTAWAVELIAMTSTRFEQFKDYSDTLGSIGLRIAELEIIPEWSGEYKSLRPSDWATGASGDYLGQFGEWYTESGREPYDVQTLISFYKGF